MCRRHRGAPINTGEEYAELGHSSSLGHGESLHGLGQLGQNVA
jgi:hypothetical protein